MAKRVEMDKELLKDLSKASQELQVAAEKFDEVATELRCQLPVAEMREALKEVRPDLERALPEIGVLAASECGACGACGACVVSPTPDIEVAAITAISALG